MQKSSATKEEIAKTTVSEAKLSGVILDKEGSIRDGDDANLRKIPTVYDAGGGAYYTDKKKVDADGDIKWLKIYFW